MRRGIPFLSTSSRNASLRRERLRLGTRSMWVRPESALLDVMVLSKSAVRWEFLDAMSALTPES